VAPCNRGLRTIAQLAGSDPWQLRSSDDGSRSKEHDRLIEVGFFGPDERLELIDGEIVAMSPIGARHASCVARIAGVLGARWSASTPVGPEPCCDRPPQRVPAGCCAPPAARRLLFGAASRPSRRLSGDRRGRHHAGPGPLARGSTLPPRRACADVWLVDLERISCSSSTDPPPMALPARAWFAVARIAVPAPSQTSASPSTSSSGPTDWPD
jgi:hypothetical protein